MIAEILITPHQLKQKIPLDSALHNHVSRARNTIINILNKQDKRLLLIIGPCSIHDPKAALDYAERLKKLATAVEESIFVVMRVYLEKPRTTVGWQGLIKDPKLDNSFDVNKGLTLARKLLAEITALDLPVATEFLDPLVTPYISDFISWGAIGARTCESQIHRNLASGLEMPIGFKNGTSGAVKTAIDALITASQSNYYLGLIDTEAGILKTKGNKNTHVVLRGGSSTGPNYGEEYRISAMNMLGQKCLPKRLMIDCSHANSGGDYSKQIDVLNSVAVQFEQGKADGVIGLMLESFIEAGSQSIPQNLKNLDYGKSITDGCISWPETEDLILKLAESMRSAPLHSEQKLVMNEAIVN